MAVWYLSSGFFAASKAGCLNFRFVFYFGKKAKRYESKSFCEEDL